MHPLLIIAIAGGGLLLLGSQIGKKSSDPYAGTSFSYRGWDVEIDFDPANDPRPWISVATKPGYAPIRITSISRYWAATDIRSWIDDTIVATEED